MCVMAMSASMSMVIQATPTVSCDDLTARHHRCIQHVCLRIFNGAFEHELQVSGAKGDGIMQLSDKTRERHRPIWRASCLHESSPIHAAKYAGAFVQTHVTIKHCSSKRVTRGPYAILVGFTSL
jgi:hypothetical protein